MKKENTYKLDTSYKIKHINIGFKVNSIVKITLKKNNDFYLKCKNKFMSSYWKKFFLITNNLKSVIYISWNFPMRKSMNKFSL